MQAHIRSINIGVRDLDRAVAFYRDAMGFELLFSAPEHHYARFSVGGFNLGLGQSDVDHFTGGPPGDRHTGVSLAVEDVDAAYEELKARGVVFTMEPTRQPWGGYMAMLSDPDGNLFYLDTQ